MMEQPHTARKTARYGHIDSLRGIAILLVAWLHVTEVFKRIPSVREHGDWLYLIAKFIDSGRIGVVIFFAVSGFVICSSLQERNRYVLAGFLIKRFFRLYPAYWLAIVLGSFLVWKNYGGELSPQLYLANATMIPTLFGIKNMMGLLWTLETELIFYLFSIVLFWLKLLHRPLALAALCALLVLLYGCFVLQLLPAPATTSWNAMPYHLAIIFWGGIARMYYDNPSATVRILGRNIGLMGLLFMVALLILLPLTSATTWQWLQTGKTKPLTLAVAYIAGMTIFFVGAFVFKLQHRAFVWLGTISYSFYLLHPVIFTPIFLWAYQHRDHPLAQLHMGIYLAIVVLITMAFSELVYRLIEAPSNRLARRLASRSASQGNVHA